MSSPSVAVGVDRSERRAAAPRSSWAAPGLIVGGLSALGFAAGGYFPVGWAWGALACFWVAATVLWVGFPPPRSREQVLLLAALLALTAWTGLSAAWSSSASASIEELERMLLYVSGALAFIVLAARARIAALLGALLAGITLLAGYGLLTRLFPDHFGAPAAITGYRLAAPLGYWNGLGALAVLGMLLAAGLSFRLRTTRARSVACAALPSLALANYFTFSRGAWLALACGAGAMIALEHERIRAVGTLLVLLTPAALGVWLASRAPALVHQNATVPAAAHAGHRLAVIALALTILSAGLCRATIAAEPRVIDRLAHGRTLRRALVTSAVLVLAFAFGITGAPAKVGSAFSGKVASASAQSQDLTQRLTSFKSSGRVDLWRAALHDFAAHPLVGSGAGSYEQYWYRHRPNPGTVRDAHNLYLETLAELGAIGLLLLVALLAVPVLVVRRARGHPLLALAAGGYVTYLAHAGFDWDWELPAVTLAGLICALTMLEIGARRVLPTACPSATARAVLIGAALLGVGASLAGLVGQSQAAAGAHAAADAEWGRAQRLASTAATWEPWSPTPWRLMAEAAYGEADFPAAARYYRVAIERDPNNWQLWRALGYVLEGAGASAAFREAHRLNPLEREIPEPAR